MLEFTQAATNYAELQWGRPYVETEVSRFIKGPADTLLQWGRPYVETEVRISSEGVIYPEGYTASMGPSLRRDGSTCMVCNNMSSYPASMGPSLRRDGSVDTTPRAGRS